MRFFFLWIFLLPEFVFAQADRHPWPLRENTGGEKLFFVADPADTTRCTGSVETATGKKILPNGFVYKWNCEALPEQELFGNFTLIAPKGLEEGSADTAMHYSYRFATFNPRGQFLHHPFVYDNGPDYWQEGRRRAVEGGKMGLVNRLGRWVVPAATYRFLEPARKGFVWACRDCSFYNPGGEEHGGIFAGTDWDVLDVNGTLLSRGVNRQNTDDPAVRWLQSIAQVRLSPPAQKLADQLLALPQVADYARIYHTPLKNLYFACYDVPGAESPYYHFGLESKEDSFFPALGVQVLISPDGKEIYYLAEDLQLLVPLAEWKVE